MKNKPKFDISRGELFNKISEFTKNTKHKNINLTYEETEYLKDLVLNDKLGLKLNFHELDEDINENYVLLNEVSEKNINLLKERNNLLIEGDNYHALKALNSTNLKVDVIYIDPPYNTGKEFIYKDKFGEKIVSKDDLHKHSKWLSFIKKRLELAKKMLKDDGMIMISIDDNEQAYLKVLMDEIFGENNFISNIIWHSKSVGSGQDSSNLSNVTEYIILYVKNIENVVFNKLFLDIKNDPSYKYKDKHFKKRGKFKLNPLDNPSLDYSKTLDYVISHKDKKYYAGGFNKWSERQNQKIKVKKLDRWRWSEKKFKEGLSNGFIHFKEKEGRVYYKQYQFVDNNDELIIRKRPFVNLFLQNKDFSNSKGTKELIKIFNKKNFDHPKPTNLIKYLINFHPNKKAIVLDFFAGSGTTGEAVMSLNKEDGGKRRFILVDKNDENKIIKITFERIYRIIKNKGSNNEEILKKINFFPENSLRYLKTRLLDKFEGEFEEINKVKKLYKEEFNKDLTIKDLEF